MDQRLKYARDLASARESMKTLRQRVANGRRLWGRARALLEDGHAAAAHAAEDEFRNERREARQMVVDLSAFALDHATVEAAMLAAEGFHRLADIRRVPDETPPAEPRPHETRIGPGVTRRALERFLRDSGADAELPHPDIATPTGTLGAEPDVVLDYDELTTNAEIALQGRDL